MKNDIAINLWKLTYGYLLSADVRQVRYWNNFSKWSGANIEIVIE